ncbi:MAG: hypothetical protein HXS48_26760 [Theionarchaea archaeon]|nr:hypothetical protein [Theionarchaea archaeon]
MEDTQEKEPLKILFSKGTKEMLAFTVEKGAVRHKDLLQFGNPHLVNGRLQYLYSHGLLQHHFVKDDARREWYEPTGKGRKVLTCMLYLEEVVVRDFAGPCHVLAGDR